MKHTEQWLRVMVILNIILILILIFCIFSFYWKLGGIQSWVDMRIDTAEALFKEMCFQSGLEI